MARAGAMRRPGSSPAAAAAPLAPAAPAPPSWYGWRHERPRHDWRGPATPGARATGGERPIRNARPRAAHPQRSRRAGGGLGTPPRGAARKRLRAGGSGRHDPCAGQHGQRPGCSCGRRHLSSFTASWHPAGQSGVSRGTCCRGNANATAGRWRPAAGPRRMRAWSAGMERTRLMSGDGATRPAAGRIRAARDHSACPRLAAGRPGAAGRALRRRRHQ